MKLNKEAINNLEQNKCVATSLKSYTADMAVLTYHSGVVLTAMNAYGMYDRICDEECKVPEAISNYFKEICCNLMNQAVFSRSRGMEFDMICGALEAVRNQIIQEAQKAEQDSELLEDYASLLEILNPMYASFLMGKLAGKAEKDITPCKKLLTMIMEGMAAEEMKNLEEQAMDCLVAMEGLQERYYQPLYRYQLAFQDIRDGFAEEIEKKELTKNFALLDKTRKLLSSSPFAPLA